MHAVLADAALFGCAQAAVLIRTALAGAFLGLACLAQVSAVPLVPVYLAVAWSCGLMVYLYFVVCRLTSKISIEGPGNHDLSQHAIFCVWHQNWWAYSIVFVHYRSPHATFSHPAAYMKPIHAAFRLMGLKPLSMMQNPNPTRAKGGPSSPPKNISLTDPQSRWTAAPGGPAFYAYSTNYLVDTEHGVILDVEATPAHRTAELESAKAMVDRVEERFQLTPERFIGDTAYGTASMLAWMVEAKGIEPHVPVWERWQRNDQTLSSSEFQWDEQADEYRCPQGHSLRSQRRAFKNPRTHVTKANTIIYRASQSDCTTCPMKERCCPRTPVRKIVRSIHEAARDVARRIRTTVQYQRSRHQRKKVEILFAHLKRILKLDRLRLRGLSGASDEFTLAAAVQNLRRLAKLIPKGASPPCIGAPA
jgi:hypothetical protein